MYRYRLTDVAAHFGIDTQGAHRALKDCDMNRQCYECMGRVLESRAQSMGGDASGGGDSAPEESCPNCGGVLVKRKGKFGAFWGCSSFPRCRYTRNA